MIAQCAQCVSRATSPVPHAMDQFPAIGGTICFRNQLNTALHCANKDGHACVKSQKVAKIKAEVNSKNLSQQFHCKCIPQDVSETEMAHMLLVLVS